MSVENITVHQTITRKIQDMPEPGWEFVCPICGYHVRYIARSRPGASQLEVLHIGNPHARHVSNQPQSRPAVTGTPCLDENVGDEAWLTPRLRQQMEDLLKDVDLGDWEAGL